MTLTSRRFWLILQLVLAVAVMAAAWGFGALLLLGIVINTEGFAASSDDGTPVWPWIVGAIVLSLALGIGALRFARGAVRRSREPIRTEDPAHLSAEPRQKLETESLTLRTKLFLLALLVLDTAAVFAGMLGEWLADESAGNVPGTLLAVATFAASVALGVAYANRLKVWRAETSDEGSAYRDLRPELILIWWPITLVAVLVPLLVLYLTATNVVTEGSGLPNGVVFVVGVFGFVCLPGAISESRIEFGARGLRGFWSAAARTPWGRGDG
jgi:hypothetical protein